MLVPLRARPPLARPPPLRNVPVLEAEDGRSPIAEGRSPIAVFTRRTGPSRAAPLPPLGAPRTLAHISQYGRLSSCTCPQGTHCHDALPSPARVVAAAPPAEVRRADALPELGVAGRAHEGALGASGANRADEGALGASAAARPATLASESKKSLIGRADALGTCSTASTIGDGSKASPMETPTNPIILAQYSRCASDELWPPRRSSAVYRPRPKPVLLQS